MVVNDAYKLAPWADALYACDGQWWDYHYKAVCASGFKGELWTQDPHAARKHGLRHVEGVDGKGLCRRPGVIHHGRNSGYQAINLAWHWGARRFVLLGFDCGLQQGKRHFFGDHPAPLCNIHPYDTWLARFAGLAADLRNAGASVTNCAPASHLTCWPKRSLRDELCIKEAA